MKKNLERGEFLKYLRKTMRIMRLSLFLIMISTAMAFSATSYSQNTKLTLDLNNATVKEVIKAIEDQSEFLFFYQEKHVDLNRQVTLHATEQDVETILNQLFAETNNIYVINDRQIVIGVAPRRELEKQILRLKGDIKTVIEQPQQKEITGKVTDTDGLPLPGVSIIVKGTTIGTVTNNDGEFSLNIPLDAETLQFSFVGMRTQEVVVGDQTTINVEMVVDAIGIEEVVAVGYGIQKKVNLTGAVTQINVDEVLNNRPVTNAAMAIQGAIPGLQVTTSSGRPGESAKISVRGVSSLSGGSPLVLVDGISMGIEDVNPNDIENISVLKDASSSSIYGGRAAFGVVLITTKTGKRNQPIKFNYSTNLAINQPFNIPKKAAQEDIVKAWQDWGNTSYNKGEDLEIWSGLLAEYKANPGLYPNGETYVDNVLYRLEETDIHKKFMTNGFEHMHNFSFHGGSDKADYRVSFGFSDEDGVIITNKDSYKKFNVNSFLRTNLTKSLVSTTNILYKNDERLTPYLYGLLFKQAYTADPVINTGSHILDDGTEIPYDTPNNIVRREPPETRLGANLKLFEKLQYKVSESLDFTAEYTFMNSNSNVTQVGTDNIYWDFVNEAPQSITQRGSTDKGGGRSSSFYYKSHSNTDYHAFNLLMNYEKSFSDHYFHFLAGTNQELNKYSFFWTDKLNLLNPEVPSLETAYGSMSNGESFNDYAISGYFSRINYMYDDKYLFEGNIRYDGSSRFPKSGRYGLFPSLSAGWIVSNESFMKPIESTIHLMKFRASWGEVGNQSISSYAFIPGMNPYNSTWINPANSVKYLTLSTPALVDEDFTWETVITKNIGIDLGLFEKINITFDYFNRATLDMLGYASELPAVLGAPAPRKNVADLESKGWELTLNWRDSFEDFRYSLTLNLSDDKGFIKKFKNDEGLLSQYYEGYQFGEIWGYETQGYFTVDDFVPGSLDENLMNGTLKDGIAPWHTVIKTNPGDIRYVDLNNDGIIDPGRSTLSNPGDRKIIGNSNRRYQFGIIGNCSYKNLDLSLFFQGVGKRDLWIGNSLYFPHTGIWTSMYDFHLDYWTPENTDAFYPRIYQAAGGNYPTSRQVQTKYLSNGAYLMLKNIELGYNLPESILQKTFLTKAKIFFSGENLFQLDDMMKGIDLETDVVHYGGTYPLLRKFSLGVNISF